MTSIHILRPHNPRFVVQVRQSGHRIWMPVGQPRKTRHAAVMAMARAFSDLPVKRARVLMVTDDYFEPAQVAEMSR